MSSAPYRLRKVTPTRFEVLNRQAIGDVSDALRACGISRTELARRMGRDVSTVHSWFVGHVGLPCAVLYALSVPEAEAFFRAYFVRAALQAVGS